MKRLGPTILDFFIIDLIILVLNNWLSEKWTLFHLYLPISGIVFSLIWLFYFFIEEPKSGFSFLNAPSKKVNENVEINKTISLLLSLAFLICWFTTLIIDNCFSCKVSNKKVTIDSYFEGIRNNEAALTAFFSQMPKGGDLHNHYTGAVYAESYLENAMKRGLWLNLKTLKVESDSTKINNEYLKMDTLRKMKNYLEIKQQLFQDWSVKDFNGLSPSDKHFFSAFGKFPKDNEWTGTITGLKELKQRAKIENVQYLEIMIGGVPISWDNNKKSDSLLHYAIGLSNTDSLTKLLKGLLKIYKKASTDSAITFVQNIHAIHQSIDDIDFTMRYLVSVKRENLPTDLFKGLIAAFEAVEKSSLLVGVNIVSPEDGEISMKDYKLHMQMFKFLHQLYPNVKYSLHAGELTLGFVKPEDLTWHIDYAVRIAGANRIGHGVDMPYENDNYHLLQYMQEHKIAIEINLVSNEFILKVKDDRHPIMLYAENGVPIVISTDDAGILRTNLTEQFVLLAKRYKELTYSNIKTFIKNSIEYSFNGKEIKEELLNKLNKKLDLFERKVLASIK